MLLKLEDVLSADGAAQLRAELAENARGFAAKNAVVSALQAHPLFTLGARPQRLTEAAVRRLDADSVAAPSVVAAGVIDGIRADLGVIVMLSDPSSYEGGELTIDIGYGAEKHRLAAGACIAYPASARRGDLPVTGGERYTVELWVQSLVKVPTQREILYDVGCSLHLLELFSGTDNADVERLRRSQSNLLRLWSET